MKRKTLCAVALACSMALGVAGYIVNKAQADTPTNGYTATITSDMQGDTVALLGGEVGDFAMNYKTVGQGSAKKYAATGATQADLMVDRFAPKPATISWENSRDNALYYTVRVGLEEDLSDAQHYLVSDTEVDIDYLFAAKHYYYQIYAHYDNDEVVKSRVFDFYTADLPRTVNIPNVSNTRDIGGRYVQGGEYQVKQGMVYRGAEVDPASSKAWGSITEEGKHVMLDVLGIKTDLDLRGTSYTKSPIDDSLNYVSVSGPYYTGSSTGIYSESYKSALTTEIRTFANPDNYPIYLHCSLGRDRAGTLAYLISALVGVEVADLNRDYEMSFFSITGWADAGQGSGKIDEMIPTFNTLTTYLMGYGNGTLAENTEKFVKEQLGITQEEVDSIRNILLEKTTEKPVDGTATLEKDGVSMSYSSTKKMAKALATSEKGSALVPYSLMGDFNCTYSASAKNDYVAYGSTEVKTYTAEEAAAAGVPAGYENEVLEIIGATSRGVLLDFSAQQIPMDMVEALEFRVYLGVSAGNTGNYPQIRIPKPYNAGSAWVFQENAATPTGEWTTVTVPCTKANFSSLGENGILNKLELSVRSNATIAFYVDSIRCVFKKPVINYTGTEPVSVSFGKSLYVPASAADAAGNALELQYIWEDGVALNENGTPKQMGTYTLTLKAIDSYGGVATKTLTVEVVEGDDIAPEIALNFTEVKTMVGAKPMLTVSATDNNGNVTLTKAWSDGALDKCDRLTAGEHTWTVTAIDKFGNKATKTVTFIVTENEPVYSLVTNEGDLIKPTYTVRFDGEAIAQIECGSVIPADVIPDAPTKEATSRKEFTFAGWYFGDKLWNFETDVITGDTALVAKFTETARLYTVTFDGENAQQYEYGEKIIKPEDPVKEPTATVRYEFIGWFYLGKEWNFDTDIVNYNIKLQSKWKEVSIGETGSNDSTQQGNQSNDEGTRAGCGGIIDGAAVTMLALGSAVTVLLKKKKIKEKK